MSVQRFLRNFGHSELNTIPVPLVHACDDALVASLIQESPRCVVRNVDVLGLAREAVQACLRCDDLHAVDIEAVVFGSDGIACDRAITSHPREIGAVVRAEVLVPSGVENARVIGVNLNACGNFAAALDIADAFVSTGRASSVLVILTDRVRAPESRIMSDGLAVMSDVAVAFIVTSRVDSGMRLLDLCVAPTAVSSITTSDKGPRFLARGRALRHAARGLAAALAANTGVSLRDARYVVIDNVHSVVRSLILTAADVRPSQVWGGTAGTIGHSFGGDAIVTLSELLSTNCLQPGDRIAIFNIAPDGIACGVLEWSPAR